MLATFPFTACHSACLTGRPAVCSGSAACLLACPSSTELWTGCGRSFSKSAHTSVDDDVTAISCVKPRPLGRGLNAARVGHGEWARHVTSHRLTSDLDRTAGGRSPAAVIVALLGYDVSSVDVTTAILISTAYRNSRASLFQFPLQSIAVSKLESDVWYRVGTVGAIW